MIETLPSVLESPVSGCFLVASPALPDPNFMHTVVLLCHHGPNGSYGFVINRPGPQTLDDLPIESPLLAGRRDSIWLGGPVALDTIQIVHRLGYGVPEALHVAGDVFVGGDPEVLHRRLAANESEGGPDDTARFVVGYSGWGEGQLDFEFRTGSWVICPASEEFIFDPRPETVWRRVLRSFGEPFASLAALPPDPSWN